MVLNKLLDVTQRQHAIKTAKRTSRRPFVDVTLIQLTHLAGLPFAEIAALTITSVSDESGGVGPILRTGGGSSRLVRRAIPTHPDLRLALERLIYAERIRGGPLFLADGGRAYTPGELSERVSSVYLRAGFVGVPPGIGRWYFARSLISGLQERAYSLRDVQELMGLRNLSSLMRYATATDCAANLFTLVGEEHYAEFRGMGR
ncbi:MAG TPA: hypothetical protein VHG92_07310 [Afifellaceae bacterium]|nr:hypothetical protein [Afifellaceae bacterium]